jgi:cytochrome oxidase Cu insertion factor (SCO1/SenC/PrrC family)
VTARRVTVRLLLASVLAAAACSVVLSPPAARADGDPASDVLYGQRAFLPYDVKFPPQLARELQQLLAASAGDGAPIRVAIVASAYDLGSVGELWSKPQTYARFLGTELSLVYHGVLLVVMPDGFGLYHQGKPVAADRTALQGIAVEHGPRGLVQSAIRAVRSLASAAGHPLALPRGAPRPAAAAASRGEPVVRDALLGLLGLLLVAAAWVVSLRLRPPRGRSRPTRAARAVRRPGWRFPRLTPRRAAGLAVVIAIPTTGLIVILGTAATRAASPTPSRAAAAGSTLPSKVHAPSFRLVDERGAPVGLTARPARTTIVTFIDPACRDYCPLEAKVLNVAVQGLPAAVRPAIVAVSVDPPADTPRNVLLDHEKWDLAPQWRWAFGTKVQLARVWSAYKIGVEVVHQKTAGIALTKIVHTEAAYVVDRNGYERALFLWPFSARSVRAALEQVTPS